MSFVGIDPLTPRMESNYFITKTPQLFWKNYNVHSIQHISFKIMLYKTSFLTFNILLIFFQNDKFKGQT
jgi:hypothetical protein